MNKKLFIFLTLIIANPIFASETIKETIVPEEKPTLTTNEITQTEQNKITFSQRVKGIFSHEKTTENIEKAKDIEVVQPQSADIKAIEKEEKARIKSEEKAQKAKLKAEQDEIKAAEKAAKKSAKEKAKAKNEINAVNNKSADSTLAETSAVNKNEEKTELTNTAYTGNIETTQIIKVDECVKIALENHPAIHLAMSNAEIYKSKIAQAWANYFPTFSAGISYSRNDAQAANFAFPVQKYDMFYAPTVSGNMLIFDFGKTKAQADLAKRTYESAKFALENSINTVIFNVKQAYYNLLFAQQQVQVYEDTVADFTLHLEQAKAYYNIGTKAKIDVLTAEYNLGRAKLNLIQAKNTEKVAYVQLSNAMGMPEYSDYSVTDTLTKKAYSTEIDEAVKTAFETSPELMAAKKKADASEILVRASKRAFAPNISGFGSYSRGGKKIDTDYGYQFGAQLNYSTVNLMLLKKQVDEARATYKRDLADYENTKQNIYFEVKQAHINMTNAQESITVSKLSMEQAKEQYDQASGRYKVGLGNAIELKDAETTYRSAQLDYYNSLLTYHVSAANLERVTGSPLESSDVDLL